MAKNYYAIAAEKRHFSNRKIICGMCVRDSDEQLGFSFTARACQRCEKEVEVGIVVQEPRERRSKI
jgi:hypothetical protein